MTKLKKSIFSLEQENALHVYWGQELYEEPSDDNNHIYQSTDKANI